MHVHGAASTLALRVILRLHGCPAVGAAAGKTGAEGGLAGEAAAGSECAEYCYRTALQHTAQDSRIAAAKCNMPLQQRIFTQP